MSSVALSGGAAWCEDDGLDAASREALQKTVEGLNSPALADKAITPTPESKAAQNQVQALAGSEANAKEIYGLAAEVFSDLARKSGGDPDKMMQIAVGAERDPASFAAGFRPEQKAKLEAISRKIPAVPVPGTRTEER